jgi:hypothetical protein
MTKRKQPYSVDCLACEVGTMMPSPHGRRCNTCTHFENDASTYTMMEKDRGENNKSCACGWCKSGNKVKNQPSKH